MTALGVEDYLDQVRSAATDAISFIDGFTKKDFLSDKRTQQAVTMSLLVIGEAATKLMEQHPAFTEANSAIPWRNIRGMRNRIAHGYFDIDLDVVWETVRVALPQLLRSLPDARRFPR